nr:RNA-directed DNA polymerase like [Tanacetum cinerariifolium]GFA75670.1 RNA-directed DNA polymerase like [Tanacetum cinerariifolium]
MIKFPTARGVATMRTSKEALWKCKQIEEMQSLWKATQWCQHMEQMSRIKSIMRARSIPDRRPEKEPMIFEEAWEEDTQKEKVIVHNDHPEQPIVINGKLSIGCKQKRVQYPGWVANAVPVKQRSDTWQMQVDYSSLNKVCVKDMYPLLEVEEELGSLLGYQYKCFLRLPNEHSQVRMSKTDEEKTGFHTEEGVYYFTHMLKGLKNSAATLQRMMDKVLAE